MCGFQWGSDIQGYGTLVIVSTYYRLSRCEKSTDGSFEDTERGLKVTKLR